MKKLKESKIRKCGVKSLPERKRPDIRIIAQKKYKYNSVKREENKQDEYSE